MTVAPAPVGETDDAGGMAVTLPPNLRQPGPASMPQDEEGSAQTGATIMTIVDDNQASLLPQVVQAPRPGGILSGPAVLSLPLGSVSVVSEPSSLLVLVPALCVVGWLVRRSVRRSAAGYCGIDRAVD